MTNMIELGEPAGGSNCMGDTIHATSISHDTSDKNVGINCIGEAGTNVTVENTSSSGDPLKPTSDPPSSKNNDSGRMRKNRRNGTAEREEIGSGRSSACRSINSASDSSTAAISEEGTDNEDSIECLMVHKSQKISVAVQTDYDEDFPPLSVLLAAGEDITTMPVLFNIPDQQSSSIVAIMPSASSSDLAASCSSSADGTIQLIVQKFGQMTDTVRGPSKFVQSVPWRIMVMPRQHVVQKKGTQKCLGFFLQCCPDAYSESWACQASAELRLISQKTGVPNFTRKTNHIYTAKENDWGYSCFMTWADILDEAQGYIKDDKVILEVSVKADPPKNILSHKEFQKKIQEYKRLAEIQCQRGLIDKAIDCNLQALKFCKDKDVECKNELEFQKTLLIEMKLKQSIERIEKGSDLSKGEDDGSNLSALRHAMGTNTTRTSAAKNTQSQKSKVAKENDLQAAVKINSTQPKNEINNGGKQTLNASKTGKQQKKEETVQNAREASGDGAGEALALKQKSEHLDSSASSLSDTVENDREIRADNKALVALGQFNKSLLNDEELDFSKEKCREEGGSILPDQASYAHQDSDSYRLKCFSAELGLLSSPLDNSKRAEAFLDELLKTVPKSSDMEDKSKEQGALYDINQQTTDSASTTETACQTDFARFYQPKELATKHVIQLQQLKQQQIQQQHQQFHQQNLVALQQAGWAKQQQQLPVSMTGRQRKKATAKKTLQHHMQVQQDQQFQSLEQSQQQQYNLVMPKASPRQSIVNASSGGIIDSATMTLQHGHEGLNASGMQHFQPPLGSMVFGGGLKFGSAMSPQIDVNLAAFSAELEMKGKLQNDAALIHQPTGTDESHPPHYIEEWLRINTQNNQFNFDTSGKQFINTLNDGNMNDVNAALGILGLDCNIKKLCQKMSQFLECLESNGNLHELRTCMKRLATTIGEEYNEAVYPDESISMINVGDASHEQGYQQYSDEVSQEYIGELEVSDTAFTNRLNTIINQLPGSVSLIELVTRVEARLKNLEANEISLGQSLEQYKEKDVQQQKQIAELQKSLQAANEKNEKLSQQIKERKNDIKRLEKKAKSDAIIMAENTELQESVESFRKEIAYMHRQFNDEQVKNRREIQSLADSKKHLQTECNNRFAEIQKLTNLLEEKTQALKKNESQLGNERRTSASTIASLTERAKKAEINFLEHKLEDGLRILDRARDDCQMQMKSLEEQLKRHVLEEEQEVIKKNIKEWELKKDEVVALINTARNEFTGHINSIKNNGKQLSQLPKVQVPKPPPCPKLHPMPTLPQPIQQRTSPSSATMAALHQQAAAAIIAGTNSSASGVPPSPLPLERKAITPPSNRARFGTAMASPNVSGGSSIPQHVAAAASAALASAMPTNNPLHYTTSSNSTNTTPPKVAGMPPNNAMHFQQFHHQQQHTQQHQSTSLASIGGNSNITPIGVRPPNYQNGIAHSKPMLPSASQQQQQMPPYHMQNSRNSPAFTSVGSMATGQLNHSMPQQPSFTAQQQQMVPKGPPLVNSNSNNNNRNGLFHTWSGGNVWGDFNNLTELLGHGRSFGPLGSEFGGNPTNRPEGNGSSGNGSGTMNDGNVFFP